VGLGAELRRAAETIVEDDPNLVGVSVSYLSQALPAFALAGALRRGGFRGRLVLGGGLISSWAPHLGPGSQVLRVWDALVAGPGEGPLEGLARGVDGSEIPGILMPGSDRRPPTGSEDLNPVCFDPDPSGLPWDRYLAPGPVVPLATSRGCYWRRCAFCPEAAQNARPFRSASGQDLARTIRAARDAVGAQWFHLTDDALPLATLRRLARNLRGEGVRWYGFVRPERALLDPRFAAELADGGCAMLQLGVETASQRLLDLMAKGTRAEHAGPIVRNLAAAGIRTYVYLLFGVPTESEREAETTVSWAADHADAISFLNLALMNLPRGSDLDRNPERYGVALCDRSVDGEDLSLYRETASPPGRDRRVARAVLARARRVLREILVRTPPGFTSNHASFAPIGAPTHNE
jgi:radical SAM superfamily enzyme YgiQ (UPF0313 family)